MQISAIAAAFSSLRWNAGCDADAALDEQPDGVVSGEFGGRQRPGVCRQQHRPHAIGDLSTDPQQLPTRGDDRHLPGLGEDCVDELSTRAYHVLTVVDDQKRPVGLQVLDERFDHRSTRLLGNAEGPGRCGHDQIGVGDRGEFDQPGTSRELTAHRRGNLKSEPGLARPADTGDRDQPGAAHELLDLGEFLIPADETGGEGRQVVGDLVERDERRELGREAGTGQLEHPLGTDQVPDPMLAEIDEA